MRFSFSMLAVALAVVLTAMIVLLPAQPRSIDRQVRAMNPLPPLESKRPNTGILTVAHRGASLDAPENTMPAILRALELGAEYIELDVQQTRDGVPVILHDKTVDRTTDGSGDITALTLDEVRTLDAGSWFDPRFAGTPIPTLDEALSEIAGRGCVVWDLKHVPTPEMVRIFKRHGFGRDCLLVAVGAWQRTGNTGAIDRLLKLWPDVPLMPGAKTLEELPPLLRAYPQTRAVHVLRMRLTPEFVDGIHAAGLLIYSRTTVEGNKEQMHRKVIEAGADFVMVDQISEFREVLASYRRGAG